MAQRQKMSATKKSSFAMPVAVAAIAALAGFVAVYVNFGPAGNGGPTARVEEKDTTPAAAPDRSNRGDLAALAKGQMATFVAKGKPEALPDFSFLDGAGARRTIADWRGKVVLLNLWATWCAPCRKEMPTLDGLQGKLGGDDFEVVAVSIDKGGPDKPRRFLEEIKVRNLKLYLDPTARLNLTLRAHGLPTTLLVGRDGRELGRLVGPAEWDSEEALALIRAAIARQG